MRIEIVTDEETGVQTATYYRNDGTTLTVEWDLNLLREFALALIERRSDVRDY